MGRLFHRIYFGIVTVSVVLAGMVHPVYGREAAPSFRETDIHGIEHSLQDYRGKPLVLYFWASWCPGCRSDMGKIQKIYRESIQPGGGELVSVSLDRDLNRLKAYVKNEDLGFPVLFDGKVWQNEVARLYDIAMTPTFVLVDAEGEIVGGGHWSSELQKAFNRHFA